MRATYPLQKNRLLAALPEADLEKMLPHLEIVHLSMGEVLYESGIGLRHVYFPTTAIVSKLSVLADGTSSEIAIVGNEGLIGIALFTGGNAMVTRAVVQTAGYAYRLPRHNLLQVFHCCGPAQHLLLHYTQALLAQIAQTAVCNRQHCVVQQLCKLLLMILDRLPDNDLVITQESIASLLGVRRESITEAAGALQRSGLIHYRRGHISVLDRHGLEARACECYAVVKREYKRLLPSEGEQVERRALVVQLPVEKSPLDQTHLNQTRIGRKPMRAPMPARAGFVPADSLRPQC